MISTTEKTSPTRTQVTTIVIAVLGVILLAANVAQAQWSGSPNIYYNGGNVGIGTDSPAAPLHVANGPAMTGSWNRSVIVHATYPVVAFNSAATKWGGVGYDYSTGMSFWVNASSSDVSGSGLVAMSILNSGKIGIGTNSPTERLEVQDGFIGTYHASAAIGAGYAISSYTNTTGSTKDTIGIFGVVQSTANTRRGDFVINLSNDGSPAEVLRVNRLGYVGIGTTAPDSPLHVGNGPSMSAGWNRTASLHATFPVVVFNSAASKWAGIGYDYSAAMRFWVNASSNDVPGTGVHAMTILNSGNVGIGTGSPAGKFEVVSGTSDPFFFNGTYNKFKADLGATYLESYHSAEIVIDSSGNYSDRTFTISKDASRIGGGSPTPIFTVHENGNVNIAGTINARYQDVAEWVPSSEQLAAGTVVVLDATKSNQVISSTQSYDTRVAGVISEQPGIALGEKGDGKVLVATTGRVKIKVDASKSSIRIGDLLVTSDVPGVAMKSEAVNLGGVQFHRPGTLIGKALEPLAKGKGEILVLLSLQ